MATILNIRWLMDIICLKSNPQWCMCQFWCFFPQMSNSLEICSYLLCYHVPSDPCCLQEEDMIIKLCCYMIRSTRSPEGSPWPLGWPAVSPAATDSPREIWWTVSCNYTFLFLSRDVKNTIFNQYLPADLTSLNVSNSRFRKSVMFWRWRRHGVALWRHGRGAWHNCVLLATASNVNCWADVANHVIDRGKRVIRKISNAGSRASYGPYHGLELPNHGMNMCMCVFTFLSFCLACSMTRCSQSYVTYLAISLHHWRCIIDLIPLT